jgi:DNA-binding response OmpR family regulator
MRHVLVVDDNRDLADSLALLLEDEGCDARVAYDAEHAWEEVRRDRPDVVILDIALPGIDGLQLAHQLRAAHQRRVLLLAFTGSVLAAEQAKLRVEFDAVMQKPASLDDIMLTIRTAERRAAVESSLVRMRRGVAHAAERVRRQETLIQALRANGLDTTDAEALLVSLHAVQRQMIARLAGREKSPW